MRLFGSKKALGDAAGAAGRRLEAEARAVFRKRRLAKAAAERAEQERLAAERAEQERLAKAAAERAEQERLAKAAAERAEQERLAAEQYSSRRLPDARHPIVRHRVLHSWLCTHDCARVRCVCALQCSAARHPDPRHFFSCAAQWCASNK